MFLDLNTVIDPQKIDLNHLQAAAQAEDPTALFMGSTILENGFGTRVHEISIDHRMSVEFARAGAEIGDPLCLVRLGFLAYFCEATTTIAEKQLARKMVAKGLPELAAAATAGNAYAQSYHALAFWYGVGIGQNRKKGLDLLERAAASGETTSQYWLAIFLEKGVAVKRDISRAVHLLKTAADAQMADAQTRMASTIYMGQLGMQKDVDQAKHYARLAANQGSSTGYGFLALLLRSEAEPNIPLILDLYRRADASGSVWGSVCEADLIVDRKIDGTVASAYNLYAKALQNWVDGQYRSPPTDEEQLKLLNSISKLLQRAEKIPDAAKGQTTLRWADGSEVVIDDMLTRTSRLTPLRPRPASSKELNDRITKFGL